MARSLRVDPRLLEELVRDVAHARGRLVDARRAAPRNWDSLSLRAELLAALERLASAMTDAGATPPYRLHAEIELYRRLGRRG